jgi:hypothetical protein
MRPVHPGEVLREEYLKPLDLSANALAKALRLSPSRIGAYFEASKKAVRTSGISPNICGRQRIVDPYSVSKGLVYVIGST